MNNIWFTSDTHYFHSRILDFCKSTRRGETTEEMTELLIETHNSVVKPGDSVYHTGDFCFGGKEKVKSVKSRLNGQIHLILGNHDYLIRNNSEISGMFTSIKTYRFNKIGGQNFALSHFPMARWQEMGNGSIMLHGHTHGNYQAEHRIMDVGIDAREDNLMLPFHIDEVLEKMKNRVIISHHDN